MAKAGKRETLSACRNFLEVQWTIPNESLNSKYLTRSRAQAANSMATPWKHNSPPVIFHVIELWKALFFGGGVSRQRNKRKAEGGGRRKEKAFWTCKRPSTKVSGAGKETASTKETDTEEEEKHEQKQEGEVTIEGPRACPMVYVWIIDKVCTTWRTMILYVWVEQAEKSAMGLRRAHQLYW